MRKLKTFVAVLMLVFVLGIAVPQALAGEVNTPPGETSGPPAPGETQGPSITGTAKSPGIIECPPALGETQGPGFASWADIIFQILGNSWNI